MLGVSGDVSERRRVDEERESSERRFRAMFDSAYQFQAPAAISMSRVLEANPTALDLLRDATSIETHARRRVLGIELVEESRGGDVGQGRVRSRQGQAGS